MTTGQKGIDLIKHFESLHDGDLSLIGLQPKMDCVGIYTEGYGRAMRDDKGNFIKGIANKALAYSRISIHTEEEALKCLIEDLKPREHIVSQNIKIELNQNQFDALISYVYNTGGSETLYKLINTKAKPEDIKTWFTSHYIIGENGKSLPGLVVRREAECELFFS